MPIEERVAQALATVRSSKAQDEKLKQLEAFYSAMREAGLVTQKTYDLPQLDTIGRQIVQATNRTAPVNPGSDPTR